jgi:chromosome partitioning protein
MTVWWLSRLGRSVKIAIANLKGGVGKTTTTVYLAAVAASRGHLPVVVVDADRQASAAEWLEERPIDGVEVIEAPSERTLARALNTDEGTVVVDLPPGDERLVASAIAAADAVVIPTRAGGVEFARVTYTLGMIPTKTPRGIVITAARLGTNDLQETIDWWKGENVPIWAVVPERVGIAAGPEARLYRDGLDEYATMLRRILRST